jgi:hypothetical protein
MTQSDRGFASVFVTARDSLRLHVRSYGFRVASALPVVCLPGLARTAADGMGEEIYVCSVARDPSKMLDDPCGPHTDCLAQLYASLEAVHAAAQEITGRYVCLHGWPHIISGKFDIEGRSLHDRQRLPRLEAEPRIKTKGAVMVGRLDESDARNIGGRKVIDCRLHKFATNPLVLRLGIN